MLSNVDKLLLTPDQQSRIEQLKSAWNYYNQRGDEAGMKYAHDQAEAIRASAGYSGGDGGDQYRLIETSEAPKGFSGYEQAIENYIGSGINAIAVGRDSALTKLDEEKNKIIANADQEEAAARSAVWNTRRLAEDGMLTRGMENSGIADVITATALNQASANAYQALLNRKAALSANETARAEVEADARYEAARLQQEAGNLLGDAYTKFFQIQTDIEENTADRSHDVQLQTMKEQAALKQSEHDFAQELAMAQLKRDWEVTDQNTERQWAVEDANTKRQWELTDAETKRQWELTDAEVERQWAVADMETKRKWALEDLNIQRAWELSDAEIERQWELADMETKRKWAVEDANTERQWEVEDMNTKREWELTDAEVERQWAVADMETKRQWAVEDMNTKREWELSDAEVERQWELADMETKRQWAVEDLNLKRAWELSDAELNRLWELADMETKRKWAVEDQKTDRAWELSDAEVERRWALADMETKRKWAVEDQKK